MHTSSIARNAFAAAFFGLTLAACLQPAKSGMAASGYENGPFGYRAAYVDPASRALLRAPWRLDNFTYDGKTYAEKRTGSYMVTRWMDENNDGEVSLSERNPEPLYDLKLLSERDNGIIWAKAHPMRFNERNRDLAVHVDNYIESLSGTALYAEGGMFRERELKARDYTTFVKSKREVIIDRHPAVEAVVEVAEAEKLRADPAYRKQKIKVVFVRFGYAQPMPRHGSDTKGWPLIETETGKATSRRGILVLGYANGAEAFDRGVADFDAYVSRFSFPKSVPPAPEAPAAAQTVSAPAPSATPAPPAASMVPPPAAP